VAVFEVISHQNSLWIHCSPHPL